MPSGRAVVTSGSLRVGYLILALYSILGIASTGLSLALTLGLSAVAQAWRGSFRGAVWITDVRSIFHADFIFAISFGQKQQEMVEF